MIKAKSLSVLEVLVPFFLSFFLACPLIFLLYFVESTPPSSSSFLSLGLCRDIHLGALKLQLYLHSSPPFLCVYSIHCLPLPLFYPFCAHRLFTLLDGSSERGEKDASKITTYPPGTVRFDCEMRAVQVSCGFHHSGRFPPPPRPLPFSHFLVSFDLFLFGT